MSAHTGDMDESPEDVAHAKHAMGDIARALESMAELDAPLPGSVLADESTLTPVDPISSLAVHFDSICRDNLSSTMVTCARALEDNAQHGVPAFALYSQIRSAIEAAAWGYWLLVHSRKDERIYRALSITLDNVHDFADVVSVIGGQWDGAAQERAIDAARTQVPGLRNRDIRRPPSVSDVLRMVDRKGPASDLVPAFEAWKLCSGITHGSRPVIFNLSTRRRLTMDAERFGVTFEMQARVYWIAEFSRSAMDLHSRFRERYVNLATTDYARRPVATSPERRADPLRGT